MKAHTSSLQYFVVQQGRLSNKLAVQYILSGRVLVNGQRGQLQQPLYPQDEVLLDGKVLKEPAPRVYLLYYKPRGIETTLNPTIPNNLLKALPQAQRVFPVGRLDKESEGLLLLTNDGQLYGRITHADHHQEKEYLVTVDKALTPEALAQLATGVVIMGRQTRPAKVVQVGEAAFTIVLTQGLNRQIRRMCYKLGYQVTRLVRTRMVNLHLSDLQPGQWRELSPGELQELKEVVCT